MSARRLWLRRARVASHAALLVALLSAGGLAAEGAPLRDAATSLACPRGETTTLRGDSEPGAALLVHFAGRPVGGASARGDGSWAIPLRVAEPPGIYPVAVTRRDNGGPVASFTCYVDLPVGATPTTSPAPQTPRPSSSDTPITTIPRRSLPEQEPPHVTIAATPAREQPVSTSAPPREAPPPATTEEATTPEPVDDLLPAVIVAVQPQNPIEHDLFEYVLLQNPRTTDQILAGWSLTHAGSGERYAIPTLALSPGGYLMVWSGSGIDDPLLGNLYWPAATGRWAPGDTAELVDATGQVVSRLQVELPAGRP